MKLSWFWISSLPLIFTQSAFRQELMLCVIKQVLTKNIFQEARSVGDKGGSRRQRPTRWWRWSCGQDQGGEDQEAEEVAGFVQNCEEHLCDWKEADAQCYLRDVTKTWLTYQPTTRSRARSISRSTSRWMWTMLLRILKRCWLKKWNKIWQKYVICWL